MKTNLRKKGTRTSSFGSPGRINHNSTTFYISKLYEGLPKEQEVKYIENPISSDFADKIFCKSSENMQQLPDSSVHLITGRMKTLYNSKVFVVDFIPPLTSPLFLFPSFAHPI